MTVIKTELPLRKFPYYSYSADVEGIVRNFVFTFSDHYGVWHMDIYNPDNEEVVTGIKLVPDYPMLLDYALEHKGITGAFYLMPISAENYKDFSTDVEALATYYQLFYFYDDEA